MQTIEGNLSKARGKYSGLIYTPLGFLSYFAFCGAFDNKTIREIRSEIRNCFVELLLIRLGISSALIKYKDWEIGRITKQLKRQTKMIEGTLLDVERAAVKQLPQRVNILRMLFGGIWIYYMISKYEQRDFFKTFEPNQFNRLTI